MLRFALTFLTSAVLASQAWAGPTAWNALDSDDTAWFYNRPGITLPEIEADTIACREFANAAVSGGQTAAYQNFGLAGGILVGLNSGAPVAWHHDNCMIARGYRRYTTSDRNLRAFADRYEVMTEQERMALISGETPPDSVLSRQWANDYWTGADPVGNPSRRIEMRAGATFDVAFQELEPADMTAPISLGADQVLLIFSVQFDGPSQRRGATLQFTRDDRTSGRPDRASIGRNGSQRWPMIRATVRERDIPADGGPVQFAFVAPAGFYSLSGLQAYGAMPMNICMGTLAFDATPGSVLDLGSYTFARSNRFERFAGAEPFSIQVHLDVDNARRQLAIFPDLVERVRAAPYENGFVRPCGWYNEALRPVYGIDMPGAPWPGETVTSE